MAEAGAKTKTLMRIVVSSIYVDDQDKALASYTTKLGFVKKTEIPVVVPFDFHRVIASQPNALDCNHAEAQTADRKAIPSGNRHLRRLQCSVQVWRIFPRCRYSGTV
jgi:hypothetical protein